MFLSIILFKIISSFPKSKLYLVIIWGGKVIFSLNISLKSDIFLTFWYLLCEISPLL